MYFLVLEYGNALASKGNFMNIFNILSDKILVNINIYLHFIIP